MIPLSLMRIGTIYYERSTSLLVIRMANGRTYTLKLGDIPGADSTAASRIRMSKNHHYFRVTQESGNTLEIPWDVILHQCELSYEHYNGQQNQGEPSTRKLRIGKRVAEYRKARGLTITSLAEQARMERPNLSRLEHGKHVPSLETLERVAAALGIGVVDLVAEERA